MNFDHINPFKWALSKRNAVNRVPVDEVEKALDKLCTPPSRETNATRQPTIPATAFREIRNLLSYYDDPLKAKDWAARPRIFTILRNIRRLDTMNDFVHARCLDDMLPFAEHDLPVSLGNSRREFVEAQAFCLTEAAEIEKGENGRHVQFNYNGDLHFFKVMELGSGGFGHVDKVWSRLSHQQFARKKFLRSYGAEETQRRYDWFEREIGALKKLSHRHLTRIRGTYADPYCFAFLMEPVAECNLQHYLSRIQVQHLSNLRNFFGCLANATTYLHDSKVYHMDIKLLNILVKGHRVYLTDFGAAHDWSQKDRSTTWAPIPRTLHYVSPEQAGDQHAPKNYSIDIWSLGVVFLEMATVLRGAKLKDFGLFLNRYGSGHPHPYGNPLGTTKWLEKLRSREGPDYDNFPLMWVKDMLARDPKNRPYARQIRGLILEAQGFCGSCCALAEQFCEPSPYLGGPADDWDDGSIADFIDAEEIHVTVEDDLTALDTQRRTTIQSWIDRAEALEMKQSMQPTTTSELPFIIEDDDELMVSPEPVVSDEFLNPIPARLSELIFQPDSIDRIVGGEGQIQVKSDDDVGFDVEFDDEGSRSPCASLAFDVESDGSNSADSQHEHIPQSEAETHQAEIIEQTLETIEEETESIEVEPTPCTILQSVTEVVGHPRTQRSSVEMFKMLSPEETRAVREALSISPPTDTSANDENKQTTSLPQINTAPIRILNQPRSSDATSVPGERPSTPNLEESIKIAPSATPLTMKNLQQLETGPSSGSSSVRKRNVRLRSVVSAKKYMQQVCKKESEAATSVMSERTRTELKGLTLTVWMSGSAPILEKYIKMGKVEAVRALLKAGCNPGTKNNPKKGPLLAAVKGASLRHNKCADALLKYGANVNMKLTSTGKTALSMAIEHQNFPGYRGLIWTLLHWGANPNIKDRYGDFPLLRILYGGYEPLEEHKRQALALILEQSQHPTDVNVEPPGTLNMPLHLAVRRRDPWAVGMLLEKGAKVHARNGAGQTPFALAVSTWSANMSDNHKEVSRLLLKHGASANECTGTINSPALHSAMNYGQIDLVALLVQYEASPEFVDGVGHNAYGLLSFNIEHDKINKDGAAEIKTLLDIAGTVDVGNYMHNDSGSDDSAATSSTHYLST